MEKIVVKGPHLFNNSLPVSVRRLEHYFLCMLTIIVENNMIMELHPDGSISEIDYALAVQYGLAAYFIMHHDEGFREKFTPGFESRFVNGNLPIE